MTGDTSIYLDAARLAVAMTVLLTHAEDGWAPCLLPDVSHLGLVAVRWHYHLGWDGPIRRSWPVPWHFHAAWWRAIVAGMGRLRLRRQTPATPGIR